MVWLKFAAAMLAGSLRALLGKLNEAMGLGIGIAVEVVANVEAEIPGFLLDLRRDHGRHRAGIHLAGDLGAQVIDDFEPTIAALETPAHGGFGRVTVAVTEYIWIPVAEDVSQFLFHYFLHVEQTKDWFGGIQRHPKRLLILRKILTFILTTTTDWLNILP